MKYKTILELFYKQVEKRAESIAIVDNKISYTYSQINQMSEIITKKLEKINLEQNIGIFLPRSANYICSILAVIKTDRVFVPIDVDWPIERIKYILLNAKIKTIICAEKIEALSEIEQVIVKDLKILQLEMYRKYVRNNSRVYIMYTSGTTGEPKGVKISNDGIVNLVNSFHSSFPEVENYLFSSSISFDASIVEIFVPLLTGKKIFIPTKSQILHGKELYKYISVNKVEFFESVPSLLKNVFDNRPLIKTLKVLITEGEAIENSLKDKLLLLGYNLYNAYGPTEMTVCVSLSRCKIGEHTSLGSPILNTYMEVDRKVESNNNEIEGELIVWGDGLSEGYLNDIALTEKYFCKDGEIRKYRTGDQVKILNGQIYFMGRNDSRIKINGCRIDLNEIESKAKIMFPLLEELKIMYTEIKKKKRIIMFYVGEAKEEELYRQFKLVFPDNMIPNKYIKINEFPVSVSGKINERLLINTYLKNNVEEVEVGQPKYAKEVWYYMGKQLGISVDELWKNKKREFNCLGVDSLDYMRMVVEIEEHFAIEVTDILLGQVKTINIESFVSEICILLKEKKDG